MRIDEYVGFDGLGLAALIRGGEVSAAELLDTALAQAVATDGLGAVVDVQEAVARASIAAGLPAGAFTGVPFLLKDLGCEAIDFPTSMGSGLFREHRYGYDSELYTRLRAAGLVTFGRTASPELGIGPTTEAKVYGRPTRNPWQQQHIAGGSSGGSAAAVAAGVTPVAHGSDGGGSVRIPASSCGLFGMKPTRALLPDGPASGEGWAGMAIDGFLTRSVRDTAALLDATVGPDLGAPYYAPALPGTFTEALARPPRRLRIAVSTRSFTGAAIHADCVAAVEHTARLCEALGHELVPVDPSIDIVRFMHVVEHRRLRYAARRAVGAGGARSPGHHRRHGTSLASPASWVPRSPGPTTSNPSMSCTRWGERWLASCHLRARRTTCCSLPRWASRRPSSVASARTAPTGGPTSSTTG